jgi:hypothetical protein
LATESGVREGEFPASRFSAVARERTLVGPVALVGAIALALVVRLVLTTKIVTPWIMVDELIYSEMAKSFADQHEFLIRGLPSGFSNVAYPALISPAWLASSTETAYGLAKAINVVLMLLTALPVFFWSRRLMSPLQALVPVALVLVMPAYVYTGNLMTENAFFPAFVTACFLIALTLERPTLARQALVLVLIGLTCAVRFQGLVLVPIYVIALGLALVLDLRAPDGLRGVRAVGRELRRYLPTAGAFVVLGGGYVLYKSSQGLGLETGLGAYGGVVKVEYNWASARSWVVDHFAELGFSVALVPVSALIVLAGLAVLGRKTTTAERAFLAVAATALVLVVVQVAVYASRFALRIEERNTFCVAPLLFIALALWLARGMPRPAILTAVAAIVPAALLLTLDLPNLLTTSILSDTFGLIPLLRLSDQIDVDTVRMLMLVGAVVAAASFALLPRRVGQIVLPAGVAIFLVLSSYSVFGAVRNNSKATLALTSPGDPNWIDGRIGTGADAGYVYGLTPDLVNEAQVMWQTEFWNRSVGKVFRVGPQEPAPLAESPSVFDLNTGRLPVDADTAGLRYAVAPRGARLAGIPIERRGPLTLYRLAPPARLAELLGGVYSDGWMGNFAALTHYGKPARAGRLELDLSRKTWGGPNPSGNVRVDVGPLSTAGGQPAIGKVTATRTGTVRNRSNLRLTVPTPAVPYRVEIHLDPTFVPRDYKLIDARELGAKLSIRHR